MHENDAGTPQKEGAAAWRTRMLVNHGCPEEQCQFGVMFKTGGEVPQDDAEAVRWFRLAAEQGHAEGQSCLGLMYESGRGVTQDYVPAHMWYNLACYEGHEDALQSRERVARQMTEAQIAKAQRLARDWKPVGER